MKQSDRKAKKKPSAMLGQLDLFGAPDAANAPERKAANDALAPMDVASELTAGTLHAPLSPAIEAPFSETRKLAAQLPPAEAAANSNAQSKRPRGRPRNQPPIAAAPMNSKADEARDGHAHALRDEWWNSKMVCTFLKISRKTLWERRRAKDLDFPRPAQLGGARNLYRASAIRAWAERMADAEFQKMVPQETPQETPMSDYPKPQSASAPNQRNTYAHGRRRNPFSK